MSNRKNIAIYLTGFAVVFAFLITGTYAGIYMFGGEALPMWLMPVLSPIAALAVAAGVAALFLKKTARMSRRVQKDGSELNLRDIPNPQEPNRV